MHGLARVSVETGVVFLPVETPYDQDLLFEYLRSIASAHREVQVELQRLRLLVSENGARRHRCTRCDRLMAAGSVRYLVARRSVCVRCARALVRDAEDEGESDAGRGDHGHDHCEDRTDTDPGDHLRL